MAEVEAHSLILWGLQDGILDRGELLQTDGRFLYLEFLKVSAASVTTAYDA